MTIPTDNRDILFDGQDLLVVARQAGRDRGVITFGPWSLNPLGSAPAHRAQGFGEQGFHKDGIDALHVIPRRNHWYNCAEQSHALDHAREFVASRTAVTYGTSMGGYGAALFSSLLGVPCISIAPQFSLDPEVAPFEVRWQDDLARIGHFDTAAMHRSGSPSGYMIYDPFTALDARQVRLFRDRSDLVFIPCPFTGHGTSRMMNQAYGLKRLIIEVLDGKFDASDFIAARRAIRRDYSLYLTLLYIRARSRKKAGLAARVLALLQDRLDDIDIKSLNALFAFAMRQKNRDEAKSWAEMAARQDYPVWESWLIISRMFNRLSDRARAVDALNRGLALAPGNGVLQNELRALERVAS